MDSNPLPRGGNCLAAILAAMAVLFALLTADSAHASRGQRTIFDATRALVFAPTHEKLLKRVRELDALGTDVVRIYVPWYSYSPTPDSARAPDGFDPTDPEAYPQGLFVRLDDAIEAVQVHGMEILLTPTGPFPEWASRSRRSTLADPRPGAYRRFVVALGRRYSGSHVREGDILPRVSYWAVWNEPNLITFLAPQFRRGEPYAPRLYRRLFIAADAALKSTGHGRDRVLVGETATTGSYDGINPVPFLRGFMCLNRRWRLQRGCDPIDVDGWSHHPYGYAFPPHKIPRNPGMVSMRTIYKLIRALRRVHRAGASTRRLGIFITEYGILSQPISFGVTLNNQAGLMAVSEYMAWREPTVRAYGQYLLHDNPLSEPSAFTTGLRLADGRAKPSLRSFPLTLLVRRDQELRRRVWIWGHVRPGAGRRVVTVRFKDRGRRERVLRRVRTSKRGYFQFPSRFVPGRRWSLRGRVPGGRRIEGPRMRAYRVPDPGPQPRARR